MRVEDLKKEEILLGLVQCPLHVLIMVQHLINTLEPSLPAPVLLAETLVHVRTEDLAAIDEHMERRLDDRDAFGD
jgi:hypothetical protein